jgi:hypothetical protein
MDRVSAHRQLTPAHQPTHSPRSTRTRERDREREREGEREGKTTRLTIPRRQHRPDRLVEHAFEPLLSERRAFEVSDGADLARAGDAEGVGDWGHVPGLKLGEGGGFVSELQRGEGEGMEE